MKEVINIDNSQDLLNYALSNGIIDLSYVQEQINMRKREEILQRHQYKIWQGYDDKWHTYVPDETRGRIAKKSKTYDGLVDLLIEFYSGQCNKKIKVPTFIDVYHKWRKTHDLTLTDNSITKYDTDFTRFFQDTEFGLTPIDKINSETIQAFILTKVKDMQLTKKACKTLFGYIRNTIYSARVNKYIFDNPMEFLEAKQFYKFCTDKKRPKEKDVITDDKWKMINSQIERDKQNNPSYLPNYAVQLAMLTGFRVGELAALRWDAINDEYILVDKSEKYNRKTKEYFIDGTKNEKVRLFPMTPEIKKLLNNIKRVSVQSGILTEWVFSNHNGRIHAPMISSCIKNKCIQLDIVPVGIHACRRTLNSKLKQCGVPTSVAAALLGHSEQVNNQYYTFDVSTMKEKTEMVTQVNSQISKCM